MLNQLASDLHFDAIDFLLVALSTVSLVVPVELLVLLVLVANSLASFVPDLPVE
jgi:hypothetical protein